MALIKDNEVDYDEFQDVLFGKPDKEAKAIDSQLQQDLQSKNLQHRDAYLNSLARSLTAASQSVIRPVIVVPQSTANNGGTV